MTGHAFEDLIPTLQAIGVKSGELAALVRVSHRAVNHWMCGRNRVPGPVVAYLELLSRLPNQYVAVELDRLRRKG